MLKVVIVGGSFAGLTAARALLKAGCEVTIYERKDVIGYMGGSFPLWIKGQLKEKEQLFFSTAIDMQDAGARVSVSCEVTQVDFSKKTLTVVDKFGRESTDKYDRLILATGSRAREYPVAGMNLQGIYYVKFFDDANAGIQNLASLDVEHVGIVGGGYIGCELAEACRKRGKEVTILELSDSLLPHNYDKSISSLLEKKLRDLGVKIVFSRVKAFRGDGRVQQIVHESGVEPVEMVFFSAGFFPVADIGDNIERIDNGAYLVNEFQETSVKHVYAVGDCSASYHQNLKIHRSSFFASNAMRTGSLAANHILGKTIQNPGTQDSNAIVIDGLYLASTGISEQEAREHDIKYAVSELTSKQLPEFMAAENADVHIRLIYRQNDRVLIGAQLASEYDITPALNYYSLAIQENTPIETLALSDLFFMPHFNQAYNYHMLCALGAG